MKLLFCLVVLGFCCLQVARAQLQVSGQASAAFVKANDGESQYAYNAGRPTFAWRWDLFADAIVSDDITFLSNFRMLQDQVPHIDLFELRVTDIASSGVNAETGEIDIPFGDLGEGRFPKENPFFNLPLINEHITALCKSDYKVWSLIPDFAIAGDGVRLLDQGLYDLGVKVYGSVGIFDYGVAIINGMISSTGTYYPNGLDPHHDVGKVGRLAATPFTGLTIGISYGFGPFLNDESETILDEEEEPDTSAFYGKSPDNYLQRIVGGDVNFSLGHFVFESEVINNTWQYLHGINLKALGYSSMIDYAFTPRLSGAVRAGGIFFNKINSLKELNNYYQPIVYSGKWDHNVFRLEFASGYKLDEALLLKVGYQINKTYDLPKDPVDNMLFVQSVLSF